VSSTAFYLVFVPGLTLAVVALSFAVAAFAFTQGPFQPTTRRGLLSLSVVLVVVAGLFMLALRLDHPMIPR
jgi:hypothetical protein